MDQTQPVVEQRLLDLFASNAGAGRPQPFLQADPAENKTATLRDAAHRAALRQGLTFVDVHEDRPATPDQMVFRTIDYAHETGPWSQDATMEVIRGLNRTLSSFHKAGAGVLVLDGVFDNPATFLKQTVLRMVRPTRLASLGLNRLSVVWGAQRGTSLTGEPQDLEALQAWSWTPGPVAWKAGPDRSMGLLPDVEGLARAVVRGEPFDLATVEQHFGSGVLPSQQHFGYDLAHALVRQVAGQVRQTPATLVDTVRRMSRGMAPLDDGQFVTAVEALPQRLLEVLPGWASTQTPGRLAPEHLRALRQAFAQDPSLPADRRQLAVDVLYVPATLAPVLPTPPAPSRVPRMA